MMVYDIAYALAARSGREGVLFGDCAPAAREAVERSLAGPNLPEFWFEIPLKGSPWFDLHALISYESVTGTQAAFAGQGGAYADALSWFAAQPANTVRQLALSYDTSAGDVDHPAVQLLVSGTDVSVPLGFLDAAGRPDAKEPYRTFVQAMPKQWFACYVGVFPQRQRAEASPWVRIECIVGDELQEAYADDAQTLREHLAQIGLGGIGEEAIAGIRELARSPFPLELQFNVGPDGAALPVISASVRFQPNDWADEACKGDIKRLMCQTQNQGLADDRWLQLENTAFVKRLQRGDEGISLLCFPAFLKLRWQAGGPTCAKVYLMVLGE